MKGYSTNGATRYDALYLDNVNAETRRVYAAANGIKGDWGFFLKRVGGGQQLGIGEDNKFEPASMIKIVHAVTAMRDIQNTRHHDRDQHHLVRPADAIRRATPATPTTATTRTSAPTTATATCRPASPTSTIWGRSSSSR